MEKKYAYKIKETLTIFGNIAIVLPSTYYLKQQNTKAEHI